MDRSQLSILYRVLAVSPALLTGDLMGAAVTRVNDSDEALALWLYWGVNFNFSTS